MHVGRGPGICQRVITGLIVRAAAVIGLPESHAPHVGRRVVGMVLEFPPRFDDLPLVNVQPAPESRLARTFQLAQEPRRHFGRGLIIGRDAVAGATFQQGQPTLARRHRTPLVVAEVYL